MKQAEVETVISLRKAFLFPRTKRIRKALNEIKGFVLKHEKNSQVVISTDVNKFLSSHSKNIPRKINAVLVKEDKSVSVYLKGSKQLEEDKKKKEEEKKAKEKEKKEKKEEKLTEKQKERLEEKRQKEKAAKSVEMKTGRK